MANGFKLPKGPSNSAGMGATPGTQQTALNNVGGANLNPNMPVNQQLAKQARSSYQQGLQRQARPPVMPTPPPASSVRQPAPRQTPVVSRALPMQPGRGYNIFSGQDAESISNLNQTMGISNMTALPPLGDERGGMLRAGQQMSGRVMSGEAEPKYATKQAITYGIPAPDPKITQSGEPEDYGYDEKGNQTYTDDAGITWTYFEETDNWQKTDSSGAMEASEFGLNEEEVPDEALKIKYGLSAPESGKDAADQTWIDSKEEEKGFDSEKMDSLIDEVTDGYADASDHLENVKTEIDEKYAYQLQRLLSGLDRQMAMAGMFGSGAHSVNLNNLTAQALETMAGEYAEVEKLQADLDLQLTGDIKQIGLENLNQIESDWVQEWTQQMQYAGYSDAEINSSINAATVVFDTVVSDAASIIAELSESNPALGADLTAALGSATTSFMQKMLDGSESPGVAFAEIETAINVVLTTSKLANGTITVEQAKSELSTLIDSAGGMAKEFLKDTLFPVWGAIDDFLESDAVGVAKDFGNWVMSLFD